MLLYLAALVSSSLCTTSCVGLKRSGSFSSDVLTSAAHAEHLGHFSIDGEPLACSGRGCRKVDTAVSGIASKGSVKVSIPSAYPTLAGRVEYYYSQVSGGYSDVDYEANPTLPELHFVRSSLILRNSGTDDVTLPLVQYESHDHYVTTVETVRYPHALKGHNDDEFVAYTVFRSAATSCATMPAISFAKAGLDAHDDAVCFVDVPASPAHVAVGFDSVVVPAATTKRLAVVHVMVEVGDAEERIVEEQSYESFLRANEFVDAAWFADLSLSERRSIVNFGCSMKRPSVSRADAAEKAKELDARDEL
mmetsp:Transcript_6572/g.21278  ORF Transcript_6572/g.21278 Transcript_6572/m.21278 type:complete len:306 (-) Transcript_6572:30-947(-)